MSMDYITEFREKFVSLDSEGVYVVKPQDDADDADDGGTSLWQAYVLEQFITKLVAEVEQRGRDEAVNEITTRLLIMRSREMHKDIKDLLESARTKQS